MRAELDKLTLSNAAIWEREHARPAIKCAPLAAVRFGLGAAFFTLSRRTPRPTRAPAPSDDLRLALRPPLRALRARTTDARTHVRSVALFVAHRAPWVIKGPYFALCYMLDTIFDGRPLARLWFLETVARVPYFSYISMLHLYESLGWWRIGATVKRVHFAEEWNELHHLLIMESLGGDRRWIDRFMAGHSAVIYYWVLILMWLMSPTLAYNFSELIEAHAVDTYGQFVDENAERLRTLPAPAIAKRYYSTDLYLYDEFQTARAQGSRRPVIESLYDVFSAIRDDEAEHVNTMVRGCSSTHAHTVHALCTRCARTQRRCMRAQLRARVRCSSMRATARLTRTRRRPRARTRRCWCARPTSRRRWRRRRRRRRLRRCSCPASARAARARWWRWWRRSWSRAPPCCRLYCARAGRQAGGRRAAAGGGEPATVHTRGDAPAGWL